MAETKKRIIQYNEELTPALDDYLLLDSPTAGTRKILASNIGGGSSGGGGINYSTAEQDTGLLWVDGKHIYQKTYYNTYSYLENGDSLSFGSDVINKYVINSVVMVDDGNGANTTSLYGVKCVPDGRAYFQSGGTLSGNINMYVTLWYTKTTDTV